MEKICINCMNEKNHNGACTVCGFDDSSYSVLPHHLAPGTLLAGKYMIGKVLGEGGFGITYVGLDLNLNIRVAIKEYFPSGCVSRDHTVSDTLTVFSGDALEMFNKGRDKCIDEARTVARFNDADGIVSVKDFFFENGTSYIVMEFLEGETLKEFLMQNGGKIDTDKALNIIKPIIVSLDELHKAGLIHRDISPDNIMITKGNRVKLIDFGAAREANTNTEKSLSVQLKRGYAPEEQYRSHGKQGSWTDVYALCATIYRMITGKVPEESLDRLSEDTLIPPSKLGVNISPNLEAALMHGLAVSYQDRIKDMKELYAALYNNNSYTAPTYAADPVKKTAVVSPQSSGYPMSASNKANKNTTIAVIAAILGAFAVIAVLVLGFLFINVYQGSDNTNTVAIATALPTNKPTATPVVTAVPIKRTVLYSSQYTYKRMNEIHNSVPASDAQFIEIKNAIIDFDNKCIDYMNYGNTDALIYFQPGTTAYNQQTEYKRNHPDIFEVLNDVEVYDVRVFDGTYYAWVREDMTVTEKGVTKNTISRWVYKLTKNADGYVILDYTKDPAS